MRRKGKQGIICGLLASALMAGAGLVLPGAALANVKAGVDAWTAGDFVTAVAEWQGPAAQGDPDAQFNLAQAYKLGRGVPQDLLKAEDLYRRAARQGHLQAGDNYGLLLFQRGRHDEAMPYIQAAADRGDARSQYIYGLALFNGDGVEKDWVRAYAYENLAQQGGIAQAAGALAQMDRHIPLADRQKAIALAARIAAAAEGTRTRQLAALDLNDGPAAPRSAPPFAAPSPQTAALRDRAVDEAMRAAGVSTPATAGADYTVAGRPVPKPVPFRPGEAAAKPATPQVAAAQNSRPAAANVATPASSSAIAPKPASPPPAKALAAKAPAATPAPPRRPAAPAATGPWRVQLGAFGVPGNAEALWKRVKGRPELAGHPRILIPSGKVTRLLAGGFASSQAASAACSRLQASGFACLATRD